MSSGLAEQEQGAGTSGLVLVVDDFEDAREMLATLLSFSGFQVAQASTGHQAIEQATALGPDLILMDLSLPDLDGVEATRRLKADPRTSRIPIVALTGHAFGKPLKDARSAGFDALLIKPCMPDVLVEQVQRVLSASSK